MSGKVNFIFAIHFHQPHGQLKWINEKIYENSYKLLLKIFREFSDLHFTIHISGPLLLYMAENHPDWLEDMAKLGDYGTFEFLAGSLGESILPILPPEDRVGQIREYLEVFEKHFGYRPKGLWLPERVWEPSLPIPLSDNGIEYVLVDDSTLYRAGHPREDAYYAWITEEGGRRLKTFFIEAGLRYVLPWRSSDEVIGYMQGKATPEGSRVLVWGSDAEKFGEWGTPEWAESWLRDFLFKLRQHKDKIRLVHPTEYLNEHGVRGLLYLPEGSYDKMLEWSNGFFRNFMVKYRESNNMHKKMLYVRSKMLKTPKIPREILRKYYLAQCNDAYWHGLFGGIYLSHLRQAIYEDLIRAERTAEEESGYFDTKEPLIKLYDFDYDGEKEVLFESRRLNAYFKPSDGGALFELDVKEKGLEHNLQDTMTRYPEPYLENTGFIHDWYRRVSMRIHLWGLETSLDNWINNAPFKDQGDVALKKHAVTITPENKIILRTIGAFYVFGNPLTKVMVEKHVSIKDLFLETEYVVRNVGNREFKAKIGYEYHLAPKIDRVKRDSKIEYILGNNRRSIDQQAIEYTDTLTLVSQVYPPIILETDRKVETWVSPLNMLARTEKGFSPIMQGLAAMFLENISLGPGDETRLKIRMGIKH